MTDELINLADGAAQVSPSAASSSRPEPHHTAVLVGSPWQVRVAAVRTAVRALRRWPGVAWIVPVADERE